MCRRQDKMQCVVWLLRLTLCPIVLCAELDTTTSTLPTTTIFTTTTTTTTTTIPTSVTSLISSSLTASPLLTSIVPPPLLSLKRVARSASLHDLYDLNDELEDVLDGAQHPHRPAPPSSRAYSGVPSQSENILEHSQYLAWKQQQQLVNRQQQQLRQLEPQVGKERERRGKRVGAGGEEPDMRIMESTMDEVRRAASTTVLARQQRNGRMYDVPQIECPRSPDQTERFACPRPDRRGRFRCIDDRSLCDGFYDCPGKEDESPEHCLFYKTTKAHLDILAEALLRWARGR